MAYYEEKSSYEEEANNIMQKEAKNAAKKGK
jgi:hypothetical protein